MAATEAPKPRVNTASAIRPAAQTSAAPAAAKAKDADAAKTQAAAANTAASATVTGCLTEDAGAFRLKDTTGAEAAKSRSWKSGFLKKSTPSIDLIEANNGLKLSTQVGHRVKATGSLTNHEMHVRSVQRLNGPCAS